MILVKILKRKDAASVVVAVVVGLIVLSLVSSISGPLANEIIEQSTSPTGDFSDVYLFPLVLAAVQLLVFEILARIYTLVAGSMSKNS